MNESKSSLASPEIREILEQDNYREKIRELFSDMHPYDIFSSIEDLPIEDIAKIIAALKEKGIEVFEYFSDEDKKEIFYCFSRSKMVELLEDMSSDERADFVKRLPEEIVDDILPLVAQAERNDIKKLLKYKEGTAGAIMTTEYANVPPDMTVEEAMDYLRKIAPNRETIYYIYVTDKNRKLIGFVSLREIIVAKKGAKISEIMHKDVISIKASEPASEAAKKISDYDFLALPVVDGNDALVGIVTVDDVLDVVVEEDTEDMLSYGATGVVHKYLEEPVLGIAKKRIMWLLILVFVQFISGAILQAHSAQLQAMIALAFFIPVLSGTGGNAGSQSSTTIIRGLATSDIGEEDMFKVFQKELSTGVLVGSFLGAIGFFRAYVMEKNMFLAITVFLSMIATVTIATISGAVLPILFKKMKLDPALMSGPFIASIVDIVSIFIYLEIARWLIRI